MWLLSLHVTQVLSISSAPWDEFFQSWFTSRALVLIQGIQKVLELWSWVGMGQEQGWGCSGLSGFSGSREEEFAQNEFDAVEQSVPQKWVLQPGQQQLSAS